MQCDNVLHIGVRTTLTGVQSFLSRYSLSWCAPDGFASLTLAALHVGSCLLLEACTLLVL
jgi:hypothetical protein